MCAFANRNEGTLLPIDVFRMGWADCLWSARSLHHPQWNWGQMCAFAERSEGRLAVYRHSKAGAPDLILPRLSLSELQPVIRLRPQIVGNCQLLSCQPKTGQILRRSVGAFPDTCIHQIANPEHQLPPLQTKPHWLCRGVLVQCEQLLGGVVFPLFQ